MVVGTDVGGQRKSFYVAAFARAGPVRMLRYRSMGSQILLIGHRGQEHSRPLTASPMISRLRAKARFRDDVLQKITA
jgi:hypothetical protein